MTLSDFEKELAASKSTNPSKKRDRSRDSRQPRSKSERDGHRYRSRSSKHQSRDDESVERDSRHGYKRSRREFETEEERRKRKDDKRRRRAERDDQRRSRSPVDDEREGFVESGIDGPQEDEELDERLADSEARDLKRDDWMQAPSTLDVDYVQRRKESPRPMHTRSIKADYELKLHENELNHQLRDNELDGSATAEESVNREITYTFGDSGSSWRMTKLKAVYRQAEEQGRPVEEIALERFGDLREFDDAREEEIELDRRKTYGKDYVGKIKPSGELFQERRMGMGIKRTSGRQRLEKPLQSSQGQIMAQNPPAARTTVLDQTALNKLKAQMMKAKLKGAPNAAQLEAEYNNALSGTANRTEPEIVVLSTMENRMLAGGRKGEVSNVETKRGRERGHVEENEDMSLEDMIRQERRTRGQPGGAGIEMAERIAKDVKFDNDLDYMDENAEKLSKRVAKSEINLKNMAISEFQKMNKILDNCPLCHHEDKNEPPIAPIVALATRVYLTLPTEPEISEGGACIIPIQHRINLLECDDDEWEEIRNFMKCLTRMYHDQGRDVIFYENAAAPHRKRHAALEVVPLPCSLGETAPAFFREAILTADEEWTQHKKLIDTLKRSKEGLGKSAFRRTLAKEMPYFHVWFELDGGLGHVVEDANRWPKGDLFAREIIGGMLDVEPHIIKRQGRWNRNDRRIEGFKKKFRKFDWTRVLMEG